MSVDINHAIKIVKNSNKNNIIFESGIKSFDQYKNLIDLGFNNFLIGEYFMKSHNIYDELVKFTDITLNKKEN